MQVLTIRKEADRLLSQTISKKKSFWQKIAHCIDLVQKGFLTTTDDLPAKILQFAGHCCWMGRMGRMGRMIMGLWDEETFLWGTMGQWDGLLHGTYGTYRTHGYGTMG